MYLDGAAGGRRGHLGPGVLSLGPSGGVAAAPGADSAALFADAGLERGPDGVLRLGGVRLDAIVAEVGSPAFVYNAAAIRGRLRAIETAFASIPHRVHYAVKSNGSLAVLKVLKDAGAGADIVSGGELARVVQVGFDPKMIVFSGVGKSAVELESAIRVGVGSINIESAEELDAIERVAALAAPVRPVRIGIRVNPDVAADTHPYISTGAGGIKFGVPVDQVLALAQRIAANPGLVLVSVAMHLGSQLLDVAPFAAGTARVIALIDEIVGLGIRSIEAVDVGGGLGIRYREEAALVPAQLASTLAPLIAGRGLVLHLEPGRYLTGSAGVLLTKVMYRKRSGGKEFVIVDASMTDLVRPSHYRAYHGITEVVAQGRAIQVVDVVGPVCETGDFLALDRSMPSVEPGESLAILCAGAYGFVMASNYNTRPRAPEVLVDGGRYGISRRRETLEDLLRGETDNPFHR